MNGRRREKRREKEKKKKKRKKKISLVLFYRCIFERIEIKEEKMKEEEREGE